MPCSWIFDHVSLFLSTLPARGATRRRSFRPPRRPHFYPRSPRGERLFLFRFFFAQSIISIHAPREGSDLSNFMFSPQFSVFLSTLPARGATKGRYVLSTAERQFLSTLPARGATLGTAIRILRTLNISIHAPREGSDPPPLDCPPPMPISIHAPREGSDQRSPDSVQSQYRFLSTLPARGATLFFR